jgi:plastocyanin
VLRLRSLLVAAGLAALLLSVAQVVVLAQETGGTAAMVEGSPTDINSWGFATTVQVGQSVTWTNLGTQGHTATAADGAWDTGTVAPGESAAIAFDTPGLYSFLCTPHPWMKGTVLVTPDLPAAAAPNLAMIEPSPTAITGWGFANSVMAGQALTWTNVGEQGHTDTSSEGGWDTGIVAPGASATLVLDAPGTFGYVCTPHVWMKGTIVVNAVAAGGGGREGDVAAD